MCLFRAPEINVRGTLFGSMDHKDKIGYSKLNNVNYIIFLIIKTNEMHYFSNKFKD